jgi:cell division protease FtsH
VFLGRTVTRHKNISDETAHAIDEEIRAVIDRSYQYASRLLRDNMDKLHAMADALIKFETLDMEQIDDIMSGRPPREPETAPPNQPPPDSGVNEDVDLKQAKKGKGTIGGPAQQH